MKYIYFMVLIFLTICLRSEENEFFVFPFAFYTEETRLAFGVSSGYFFSDEYNKKSSISAIGIYTLEEQLSTTLVPKIYFNKNFFIDSKYSYSLFPDKFYGIGNNTNEDDEVRFTPESYLAETGVGYDYNGSLLFGVKHSFSYYRIDDIENGKESMFSSVTGANKQSVSGAGGFIIYDKRDDEYYTLEGLYSELQYLFYDDIFGSDYNFSRIITDNRYFHKVTNSSSIGFQVYGMFNFGTVPFNMKSAVGGQSILRGYREGRYIDDNLLSFQTEYRFPIYSDWSIKGALFGSVGDVFDDADDLSFDRVKYTGGGGVRYKITDNNIHLRLDVALNNDGGAGFSFIAMEAF